MWVVCKRRKIELKIIKRKRFYDDFIDFPTTIKKHKIYHVFNSKRKYHRGDLESNIDIKKRKYNRNFECNTEIKKEKKCIFHEEQYICDIYECSGVQKYYKCNHMPYII